MNPSGTGAPERELRRRKGSRTLESHLHGGKIKRTRERARGRLGGGWAQRLQLQRLVPGLGGGRVERKLLGRSRNHLTGQRLPGRLENKAVTEKRAILQGRGSGKPHQREPGRRAWSAPVLGRGEKKGWVPIEYPPRHSKLQAR